MLIVINLPIPMQAVEIPAHLIHVCVLPVDGSTTYLITFRDTDLENHSVGLMLPIEADIVVYGTESAFAKVGIYNISPDAKTGGYRRMGQVATASTRTDIQRTQACEDNYANIISDKNPTTIKLRLTPNQATFLEFLQPPSLQAEATENPTIDKLNASSDEDIISNSPIIGAFSIQFRPNLTSIQQDIQLLQTSAGGIEVNFPGISEDSTRFIAIGNKDFGAQITFAEFPNEPLQPIPSNPRPNFQRLLQRQRYPVNSDTTLDLFKLMKDDNIQFYPYGGLIYEYPAKGFIRFDVASGAASRDPAFGEGMTIKPIEGASPTYISQETSDPKTMKSTDEAKVVKIDENGRLIISGGRVGSGAIVEAWLMEVVKQSEST